MIPLFRFCSAHWLALLLLTFSLGLLSLVDTAAQSAISVGQWRTHADYHSARLVTHAADRIFCATQNGLFSYEPGSSTIQVHSKATGLSDVGISALAYEPMRRVLLIGYANGNIDLIFPKEIVNIRTIFNLQREDKAIRRVIFQGNSAYLATGFGLVELDMQRLRIRESYELVGPAGSRINAQSVAILRDSLFVATGSGLLATSLAPAVNRLDFNNWQTLAGGAFQHLAVSGTDLYAVRSESELLRYQQGALSTITLPVAHAAITGVEPGETDLLLATAGRLFSFSPQSGLFTELGTGVLGQAHTALQLGQAYWVADACKGLVRLQNADIQVYRPNGAILLPRRLVYTQGRIIALSGGVATNGNPLNTPARFSMFDQGVWYNYAAETCLADAVSLPENLRNLEDVAWPTGSQSAFLATFGQGIFRWDTQADVFTQETAAAFSGISPFSVSSLSLAADGQTMLATAFGNNPAASTLFSKQPEAAWEAFSLVPNNLRYPQQWIDTGFGLGWIRLSPAFSGGLAVVNSQGEFRLLNENPGSGNLPSRSVNGMALALDGSLWLATDRGVAEFFDAQATFSGAAEAVTPIFENTRLLRDVRVNAVAIDGGNRKWFGTDNGLWLFNAEGSERLEFFDTRNSPLPSNRVLDLAIDPTSGEVFIATTAGLVSYRGTATAAANVHSEVKVFPNPVRPEYMGLISISGLAANAEVRITDASGRLVSLLRAAGGTAVWDRKAQNGSPVKSGVYLIFSASEPRLEGADTFVGKFAILARD